MSETCTCKTNEGKALCKIHGAKARKNFYKAEPEEDGSEE